jgi:asparagine synthase (glutamine-hydrolysing)
VTVALSGDGGDELFAGYDRYMVNLRRSRYVIPSWMGRLYRNYVYPHLPQSLRGRKFAWNISLSQRDRYIDGLSFLPALHRERNLFTDDFVATARRLANPLRQFQDYYDGADARDPLSRLLYLDMKTYLTADILAKVDRMSMATSLEMRCPILDHELVEWVAGLPVKYKFQSGTRKYLLKKLAMRLGVPSALLHRPKQGFSLPLVHWMRHELKDGLLGILTEPRTLQRGYFNPGAIRGLLDEHFRGHRDRAGAIWLLLIFELWHRNFLEARGVSHSGFVPDLADSGCATPTGSVP